MAVRFQFTIRSAILTITLVVLAIGLFQLAVREESIGALAGSLSTAGGLAGMIVGHYFGRRRGTYLGILVGMLLGLTFGLMGACLWMLRRMLD